MINLQLPLFKEQIRRLKVGDYLSLTGTLITARDSAHQYLYREDPPELRDLLHEAFIYHCGPIARQLETDSAAGNARWEWVAAGPTTSMRMDPYTPTLIERYQLQGIIGKGGMGPDTQAACQEFGAIYCQAPGGCAALLAQRVVRIKDVYKLNDFGIPEAIWVLEVKDFPVMVTMDSHGNNWYQNILAISQEQKQKFSPDCVR